ncbi:hypothetical protein DPEC_G00072880 [Dallia pectoralis]|uniref:Uncharacterized protein n=1 Tax=Dallia pectoralis TaxID=75939 RepID=A0ACC2H2X6_DALPE|nr:hypothetical protein DPEC_G00072880 [Dallia pectoralis]
MFFTMALPTGCRALFKFEVAANIQPILYGVSAQSKRNLLLFSYSKTDCVCLPARDPLYWWSHLRRRPL